MPKTKHTARSSLYKGKKQMKVNDSRRYIDALANLASEALQQ